VDCHECRQALSARLDAEDHPGERAAVDAHLAGCADCRAWHDQAAALNRLLATAAPPTGGSGIDAAVLDAAPGPWRARAAAGLRWALGLLGTAQFLLAATQIATLAQRTHIHTDQVASAGHLWHESAAWNLAIGAGFAWIAVRRARPAGITPVLTVFVTVLVLLSLGDLTTGRVQAAWLLSHGILLAGYAIILLLNRQTFDFAHPPTGRGTRTWTLPPRLDENDRLHTPRPASSTPDTPAARQSPAA
jgi:predicted anti-sigma-YlaC factor YlaD